MAKISWQRVHTQKLVTKAREYEWADNRQKQRQKLNETVSKSNTWLIGKHSGTQIKALTIQYLCFVSETFPEESPYKQRADRELKYRYNNKLKKAHKVSRPD